MKPIRFLGLIAKDFGIWPFLLVAGGAFVASSRELPE